MDEEEIKEINIYEDKGLIEFLKNYFEHVQADFVDGKLSLFGEAKYVNKVVMCFEKLEIDNYRRQFILTEEYPLQYLNSNLEDFVCYFCKDKTSVLLLNPQIKKGKKFLLQINCIVEENIVVQKYDSTKKSTTKVVDDLLFNHYGKAIVVGDAVVCTKDIKEAVEKAIIGQVDNADTKIKRVSTRYEFTTDKSVINFLQTCCPKVDILRMDKSFELTWNDSDFPSEPIVILDLALDRCKEQLILTEELAREFLTKMLHRRGIVCFLVLHISKVYGIVPANCQGSEELIQKICDVIDSSIFVRKYDGKDDILFKFIGKCTSLLQEQDSYLVFTKDVKEELENLLETRQKPNNMSGISAHTEKAQSLDQMDKKMNTRNMKAREEEKAHDKVKRDLPKSDEESSFESFQNDFKPTQDSLSDNEKSDYDDTQTVNNTQAQQSGTNDSNNLLNHFKTIPCAVGHDKTNKDNQFEASGGSSSSEIHSSYVHVNNIELDSDLADYIFKTSEVKEIAKQLACTIENENGKIVIDGKYVNDMTTMTEKIVDTVCMYSTYVYRENCESLKKVIGKQKEDRTFVTIHPCPNMKVIHSVMYKGVKVSLVHGSAADIPQTDVLLCPLDTKLNPACASAKHIIYKGGATLREECLKIAKSLSQGNKILPNFHVLGFKTQGDSLQDLQVKNVFGIVLKHSCSNIEQFQNPMKSQLKNILHTMVAKNCSSYTFPLEVGSKIPATGMAMACCCGIKELLHEKVPNIKEVFLCVVNERYLQALTALMKREFEIEDNRKQEKTQQTGEQAHGKTEIYDQRSVRVRLVHGSLIDQKVDAIVVPVNSMLKLANGAISKQVLKMAGQSVQDELSRNKPQGIGPMEVTHTGPGNLSLKHILYSNLPELKSQYGLPAERVNILMKNIFQLVGKLAIKSLALPALGTGALKYPDDTVAMEMIRAVYLFAAASGIQEVRIVVYQLESDQYRLFEKAVKEFEETVKRASKAWLMSPVCVQLDHKDTKYPIKIISTAEETGMCDVEILLRKPNKRNSQDEVRLKFIYVEKLPQISMGLTRTRIYLDESDPHIDYQHLDELYEKMVKFAIKEFSAKFLFINVSKWEPANDTHVIVGKFLKRITNVKTWETSQIQFLVSKEGLQACIQFAKDQYKGKSNFPFFWKSYEFKWHVAETGVATEGAYMVICSETEQRLQKAVSDINQQLHMGKIEISGRRNNNSQIDSPLLNGDKSTNRMPGSESSSNSIAAGEYTLTNDLHKRKKDSQELDRKSDKSVEENTQPYKDFKGTIPVSKLRHLTTKKLSELQDSFKRIPQCQFDYDEDGIKISIPYEKKDILAQRLDEHLNNLDLGVYFVRNVSPMTFHLMELYFQLHSNDWKYHKKEKELEIRKFEDVYYEAEELKTKFDSFQLDTIDVFQNRNQVPDALQDFNDKKDPKFENVLLEAVNENKIVNIHYPVDEQNIASEVKTLLQVKLQLIKRTGRRHRTFGDYSSLQPTFISSSGERSYDLSVPKNPTDRSEQATNTSLGKGHPGKNSLSKKTKRLSESTYQSLPISPKSLNFTSTPVVKPDKVVQTAVYRTGKDMQVMVYKGDITSLNVECIVNAANENLMHGGGVAAVIARTAGRELQSESMKYIDDNGPLQVGECIWTSAGKLPYKYVLHAVGPQWGLYKDKDDCAEDLRKTIVKILRCTETLKLRSVAIPSISSGIFGVPWDVCAQQYARGLTSFEEESNGIVEEVHFVDINEAILKEICDVFNTEFIPIEIV